MTDRYRSFAELAKDMTLGRDYRIKWEERLKSKFLIVAPHGGKIEKGTSELARAIAGDELSFYLFEGLRKTDNRALHITSHRFDEPSALRLADNADTVIGIHGRQNGNSKETTYLGGLNASLAKSIEQSLLEFGFRAEVAGHKYPATNPQNICNKGRSHAGAQLELPMRLRSMLLETEELMNRFSAAIRTALGY